MAAFDLAMEIVLRHEGGFVNNASDAGGATNWGISTPVYSAYIKRTATVSDIANMTKLAALRVYQINYWNVIRGNDIKDQTVANAFMDMAVLRGVTAATKSLQTVLGLKADGVIGPVSLAAINASDPNLLVASFMCECIRVFVGLVQAKPAQLQFLSIWVSRAIEFNLLAVNSLSRKSVA